MSGVQVIQWQSSLPTIIRGFGFDPQHHKTDKFQSDFQYLSVSVSIYLSILSIYWVLLYSPHWPGIHIDLSPLPPPSRRYIFRLIYKNTNVSVGIFHRTQCFFLFFFENFTHVYNVSDSFLSIPEVFPQYIFLPTSCPSLFNSPLNLSDVAHMDMSVRSSTGECFLFMIQLLFMLYNIVFCFFV